MQDLTDWQTVIPPRTFRPFHPNVVVLTVALCGIGQDLEKCYF